MAMPGPSTTLTPGLEFSGKAYGDSSRLFGDNVKRAHSIIEEKLPVSKICILGTGMAVLSHSFER